MRKTFAVGAAIAALTTGTHALHAEEFRVELAAPAAKEAPYEGRVILVLAADDTKEPRFQVDASHDAAQVLSLIHI